MNRTTKTFWRRTTIGLVGAALLVVSGFALFRSSWLGSKQPPKPATNTAEDQSQQPSGLVTAEPASSAATPGSGANAMSGLRVWLDPETGLPGVPTGEAWEQWLEEGRQDFVASSAAARTDGRRAGELFILPNGAVLVAAPATAWSSLRVRFGEDGMAIISHDDGVPPAGETTETTKDTAATPEGGRQ